MGAFARVDGVLNPFLGACRYLPAPAFIPLLLMWLGTGDSQKIALLLIGVRERFCEHAPLLSVRTRVQGGSRPMCKTLAREWSLGCSFSRRRAHT